MGTNDDKTDNVREEFLAEAQEIVESLSRDLLELDQRQKEGAAPPDLINEVFRGVHTLKGIAGMFGFTEVGSLAHGLEDLLDDLRLGRLDLTQSVLDTLFQGVERFQRLLGSAQRGDGPAAARAFSFAPPKAFKSPAPSTEGTGDVAAGWREAIELEEAVLSVLTEYEEHRLRSNVTAGVPIFLLHVAYTFTEVDSALEELKVRAKPVGEIITYLPSVGGTDSDLIELDILLASAENEQILRELFCGETGELRPVRRRNLAGRESVASDVGASPAAAPIGDGRAVVVGRAVPARASGRPDASRSPQEASAEDLSIRSFSNTVRVDIRKLDYLMNVVGELTIIRTALTSLSERTRDNRESGLVALELHRLNRAFERQLGELQDGILSVRMVPLKQLFNKLARVVRQVSREHEKEVRLALTGSETELDKLIVEELSDPLMHIMRNAIDHGIERPAIREIADKPREGTLAINAYQKGNHVVIEIEDDGAGMNPDRLYETAVRKGLLPEGTRDDLSNTEILGIIFLPGFTTSSAITDTSGRGVGMDVVKTNISRIGGVIDLDSEPGTGTKFTITLPITLAILSALLVRIGGRTFALPLNSVREAILLTADMVQTVEGREVITLRGATLPLCRLETYFRISSVDDRETLSDTRNKHVRQFVVVAALGTRRVGFVVDELEGQRDIVIKALGASLKKVRGFAGATDLGDQTVALVLDLPAIMEELTHATDRLLQTGALS